MYSGTKRGVAAMFGLAVAVVGLAPANAATDHQIRQGDFVTGARTMTAGGGVAQFGADGIHLQVKNAATDYAIGVFPVTTLLASVHTVDYVWTGTTSRPAVKYNIDIDGDGIVDGQLQGEAAYGGRDVWLNKDAEDFKGNTGYDDSQVADGTLAAAAPCGGAVPTTDPCGSSGSAQHGLLDNWARAFPGATVVQVGYGASGSVQDGVLRSIGLGTDTYTFATPTPPVAVISNPVGTASVASKRPHAVKFRLATNAQPANTTAGPNVMWTVTVNGRVFTRVSQGFSASQVVQYIAPNTRHAGKKRIVKVYKNGALQIQRTVRTR